MSGLLSPEERTAAIAMLQRGVTQIVVAGLYGVSKNTIAGMWARAGHGVPQHEPGTMGQRLDALHARLDAVMAETRDVGRLPPLPPQRLYPRQVSRG